MTAIDGIVDSIEKKGLVSGWVRTSSEIPIEVVLKLDQKIVGTSWSNVWRPDFNSACGFKITHSEDIGPVDFLLGRVKILAKAGHLSKELPIWENAYAKIGLPSSSSQLSRSRPREFATIDIPVGFVSANNSAIVGKEGYLFVYEGGNLLAQSYFRPLQDRPVEEIASRWIQKFEHRARTIKEMGIRFVEVIIPEKSSVLRELYPVDIPDHTLYYTELLARLPESEVANQVVNFSNFSEFKDKRQLYYKGDSHFSLKGTVVVLERILEFLALGPLPGFPCEMDYYGEPDLGVHLFGKSYHEMGLTSDVPIGYFDTSEMERTVIKEVPKYVGSHIVWKNKNAQYDMRILVYGNSFFELGRSVRHLSWWFSRLFTEFHFIWSPNVEFEYIRKVNPHWVIGQTIERFLPVPPTE